MASAEVLDFTKLLAPIAGTNPAGADLRADASPSSAYYAIKDARNKARADERRLIVDDDPDAPPPDWKPVILNGTKALVDKSKDLEIVAYLTEALCRTQGFAGLRDGFRLAREYVEKFWDQLYPLPDEEGVDTRVAPLTGLNGDDAEGTLITPINKIPITESKGGSAPLACYHHQEALATSKITDAKVRDRKIEQGAISLDKFMAAVNESSNKFYGNLVEEITQALEEFAKLNAALDAKCGGRAPPASSIRTALTRCLDTVKDVARHKLAVAPPPDDKSKKGEAAGGAAAGSGAASANGSAASAAPPDTWVWSRDEAMNMLLKISEFFRRTEPQSIVSFALEQVVRWGRMPLPELMLELIPEENPRKAFFKQVGIKPPEPPKDEKKK